jgi:NADPH:quinone reductase-like Zn-dependent oxidoreductase
VLGISSSDAKLERAHSLGLDERLNYKDTPEWDKWALEETDGVGVDLVVEVGGLQTLPRSLKAVRMGGTVAQIGVLSGSGDPVPFPIGSILHKWVNLQGIYVGSRRDFEDLNRAVSLVGLRPVGENFHWSQAREVLMRMEEGSHFGKLVLTIE